MRSRSGARSGASPRSASEAAKQRRLPWSCCKVNPLQQLLKFLGHLDSLGAGYILSSDAEAVIVLVRTEAGIHEVAFFGDGTIEITNFAAEDEAETMSFAELLESFTADNGPAH